MGCVRRVREGREVGIYIISILNNMTERNVLYRMEKMKPPKQQHIVLASDSVKIAQFRGSNLPQKNMFSSRLSQGYNSWTACIYLQVKHMKLNMPILPIY